MYMRSLRAQESRTRPEISQLPTPRHPSRRLTRSYVGRSDMRCPFGDHVIHPGTRPGNRGDPGDFSITMQTDLPPEKIVPVAVNPPARRL
jgi:hypothetical protein